MTKNHCTDGISGTKFSENVDNNVSMNDFFKKDHTIEIAKRHLKILLETKMENSE